jgi:proline iminopeptidase
VADSGTAERDGFKLEWVREGSGIPMVVVGSQQYYRRAFPAALRDNFEIVFCDSRQWAETPRGFDITTITRSTIADDVEAIRQVTGLDRPIVAGHSQHGAMAFVYAHHYPDRVRGVLAVAAMPPAGSEEGLEPARAFIGRDASGERLAAHRRDQQAGPVHQVVESSQELIDNYLSDRALNWYDFNFDGAWLWEGVEVNVPVMAHITGAPEALGGYQAGPLTAPVFLVLGRYDYGVPFYFWERPKKDVANLRYKLYDRSGHTPPLEQPDEFVADVMEWVKGLEAGVAAVR